MVSHYPMKTITPLLSLLLLGLLAGCQSKTEDTIIPVTPVTSTTPPASSTTSGSTLFDATGHILLSQGMFMNNVHAVSGQVKLYEKAGKRTLVFDNFRTDGGPDLRIYLAENTSLRNFIEVTRLNASDHLEVELPTDADPARQRFVLIWCKAFSVLFGSAELK